MLTLLIACACTPEPEQVSLTLLSIPAAPDSSGPHLAGGGGLPVVLSWLEPTETGQRLRYAALQDSAWGSVATVASGENWFVNWADFPSVVPLSPSRWAAHWLVKQPAGGYAYDVANSSSSDGGASWTRPLSPHDDGTPSEHGFVSIYSSHEATPESAAGPVEAGLLWLDGRNMNGTTTLRAATIQTDGTAAAPQLIDPLVCDCCSTDVALASSGPIAVYRNRTEAEIRDIYLSRMIDGVWQPGQPVADEGWKISGCPVNGPAIAARENRVAVAWYTAADNAPRVRLAHSQDSGATFDTPIDIAAGPIMGRVGVAVLEDGDTIVSWVQNTRTDSAEVVAEIRARRISRQGNPGPSRLIARTGAGRPSGFPQMLNDGEQLVFAWIDTRGDRTQLRSGVADSSAIR